MTNTKLLEQKIKQSGLKKAFIAMKIGVTAGTLSKLLKNRTDFKASQIRALCELLEINDDAEIRAIFFGHGGAL